MTQPHPPATRPHPLGPTLETERLILRPPMAEDFEAWAAFAGDPDVARFLGGAQSRAMAWRNICTMAGSWVINGFSMFSAIEKSSGRWIGRLGPWQPEGWPGPEFACGVVRETWGTGLAFEGAAAALDWIFDSLGWPKIIHTVIPEHTHAKRFAERLGSRRVGEGKLPEPFNSHVEIWNLTREEWRAGAGRRP
jgi:RimJ/RimL family protein N-acetyltransferase